MTKHQKLSAERNAKPLFEFLDSYDARLLSRWIGEQPSAKRSSLRSYLINGHIVFVRIDESGWDLFLPINIENRGAEVLLAAEAFLGPRPVATIR